MVTLCYSTTNVVLLIDNQVIASGAGVAAPSEAVAMNPGLVIGSDAVASLGSAAEAQFEEVTTMEHWPRKSDWQDLYFEGVKQLSLLGPKGNKEEEPTKVAVLKAAGMLPEDYGTYQKSGPEGNGPLEAYTYGSNCLWLEILSVTNGQVNLNLIVHGTEEGRQYSIVSREFLTNSGWTLETIIDGATNQDWTPTSVSIGARTNQLFFWAVSLGDSDADGIPDFWELEHQLDRYDSADANADPDGDGFVNLDEYLLGQDPHVADPPRPTISVVASDASASEPADPGTLTLSRTGVTSKPLIVYFTTYGRARQNVDFQAAGQSATFAVGQSSVLVQVIPIDDTEYEGSEDVTLKLLPGIHYINGAAESGIVNIADNELPLVKVGESPDEIREGSGTNGVFQFYREGDTRLALTVNFTLTGTAVNGVAYQTLPTSVPFAVDADETNLAVVPINNTNYSDLREVQLTVLANAAYAIAPNAGIATISILEDDLPAVSIVATDADAREAGLNPGRFTVTRTGGVAGSLAVFYRISGTAEMGSPAFGGDYQPLTNVVTIAAEQGTAFIDIIPMQDSESEPQEQVIITLAGSENYKIASQNAATVNIDDDEPLSYVWKISRPSVYDNAGSKDFPGVFEITRRGSALAASSLTWSVTYNGGIPHNGSQFFYTGSFLNGNLYFAPNQSKATVNLQHVSLSVTNLEFHFAGQNISVPCWRADRLVGMYVDASHNYAIEGDPTVKARFCVYRGANGPALTVKLRFDGNATPGADFNTTNVVTVNFGANESFKTVEVFANSDAVAEGWEYVIVRLDNSDLSYAAYNQEVPTTAFQETYAVFWIRESGFSGPKLEVDADFDLLNDTFEVAHGMNPLIPDDYQADSDKDGLSTLEEQSASTDPDVSDTDGDGVNDGFEISRGSNPTNAMDFALNADNTTEINCLVGDDSGSTSERWMLTVGNNVVNNSAPGQLISRNIRLKEGASYPVKLRHLSSILSPPDLDYHIELRTGNEAPPAFLVSDPQQLLGLHSDPGDGPQYTNKTATLIVPKVEMTWEAKAGNLAIENNTNALTGGIQGKRILVGALNQTDVATRNTINLRIKTIPPLVGSNVWLRAFDVDDTTDEKILDNAGVIDSNGHAGNDNFADYLSTPSAGLFVANGQSTYSTTLNSSGEAVVEFRVGMQPGNNYRLAATVFPSNNLSLLQVTSDETPLFVTPLVVDVPGFNGVVSPLLTVWRKLHLEFDSMAAVPTSGSEANFITQRIIDIQSNKPNVGQSTVWFAFQSSPFPHNHYENGSLSVAGGGTFGIRNNVFRSTMLYGTQNGVIVTGLMPMSGINETCTIRDDDERWVSSLGLPQLPMDGLSQQFVNGLAPSLTPNKPIPGLSETYAPAFIQVVDANQLGWNPRRTIPFSLNKDVFDILFSGVFDDAKDITDKDIFWAHTVTFGFQPEASEDGDPNSEHETPGSILGVTAEALVTAVASGYSAVYKESIADYAIEKIGSAGTDPEQDQRGYYLWLLGNVAHEIGHAPGKHFEPTDHAEERLMRAGADKITGKKSFNPITVRRFRTTTSWTGGTP